MKSAQLLRNPNWATRRSSLCSHKELVFGNCKPQAWLSHTHVTCKEGLRKAGPHPHHTGGTRAADCDSCKTTLLTSPPPPTNSLTHSGLQKFGRSSPQVTLSRTPQLRTPRPCSWARVTCCGRVWPSASQARCRQRIVGVLLARTWPHHHHQPAPRHATSRHPPGRPTWLSSTFFLAPAFHAL